MAAARASLPELKGASFPELMNGTGRQGGKEEEEVGGEEEIGGEEEDGEGVSLVRGVEREREDGR